MSEIDPNEIPDDLLDEALTVAEDLLRQTPIDYKPHEKQEKFHKAKNKIRFICGGNRSGKTEAGMVEMLFHATGMYPDWYPPDRRYKRPTVGRVVITDYKQGGEVFEKKLWTWLPRELLAKDPERVQGKHIQKLFIKHKSGGVSTVSILTHEQDDMQFEGWSGDWLWCDEPPPRNKFIASLRGLIDYKGICWLTLTPITEPWLYDEFILDAENDEDIFFINVSIFDNPHLPREEVESFRKRLTEDEEAQRLYGEFKQIVGRVYKDFDEQIHVVPQAAFKRMPNWPVFFVCDPHDRKPHHALWATIDPFGKLYIIDEIAEKGTPFEFAQKVFLKERMNGIKSMQVIRIGDPNKMNTPTAVTGTTMAQEFAKVGLYFIVNVNDDIATGHLAVSERMRWDKKKPLGITNQPSLYFIRETTKGIIKQLRSYVWDDWKDTGRDKKEKPKDVSKDFPDCIRYLVMFNPVFFVQESEVDPPSSSNFGTTGYGDY